MIKRFFGCRNLVAIGAVVAMTLASVQSGSRRSAASPATVDDLNLKTENTTMETYLKDYVTYSKECDQLSKKERLLRSEVDGVGRRAEDLKQRLSGVQNAVVEIIRKLKAAGEWNDVDTSLAARITNPNEKAFFQGKGFKRFLEDSANNLSNQRNEVSAPLDNLRKKQTSRSNDGSDFQIIRASYEAPGPTAPVGSKDSLGCTLGKLGLVAIRLSGGTPTNLALNVVFNQCWPAGSVSPF